MAAATLLAAGGALAAPAVADTAPAVTADGLPGAGAPADEWYAWADAELAAAQATDWAAVSAERGCELVSVEVTAEEMPEAAAAVGAPADLRLPVIDAVESCTPASVRTLTATGGGAADVAAAHTAGMRAAGADCSGTSGPGTICVSRSGGYVVNSFAYYGSGSVSGYLRIYGSCGTSPTLRTGSVAAYSYGTQRSVSVYDLGGGYYSGRFWRHVGLGHYTSWGSACGYL